MQQWQLPPTWLRPLVITLLILGIFFRFANLDLKVYAHDEVFTSLRVAGYDGDAVIEQVFNGQVISTQDLQQYQRLSPDTDWGDTLKALMTHPEHSPLYFLMARAWVQGFGSSVTAFRSLSAVLSLFAFPAVYWLCLELFESSLVAWIAIALLSIAPFHVLYAQEARPYSLWIATTLFSCAALLRAVRLPSRFNWAIYALSVVLNLYTTLFSGLVIASQVVYLVILEKFRWTRTLKAAFWALVASAIAFLPWLWVILSSWQQFKAKTEWASFSRSPLVLLKFWGLHLSSNFIDLPLEFNNPLMVILPLVSLAFVGYACFFLVKNTPQSVWLFLLILTLGSAAILIGSDLLRSGQISTNSRYFVATYVGVPLIIAYLFARQIREHQNQQQFLWMTLFALIVSSGIISCSFSLSTEAWWNKVLSYNNPQIARAINLYPQPLIISDLGATRLGNLISISYRLKPEVKFQLIIKDNLPPIPPGFSDILIYEASGYLIRELTQRYNVALTPIENTPLLRLDLGRNNLRG